MRVGLNTLTGDDFMTSDKMIEWIVRNYSWKGTGEPYTIRLVMQHCGEIVSPDYEKRETYRKNSHLILAKIPNLAVFREERKQGHLLPMLINWLERFIPAEYMAEGGARRKRRVPIPTTRRRNSKRYAKYSRKTRVRHAKRV